MYWYTSSTAQNYKDNAEPYSEPAPTNRAVPESDVQEKEPYTINVSGVHILLCVAIAAMVAYHSCGEQVPTPVIRRVQQGVFQETSADDRAALAYIDRFKNVAKKEQEVYGIPASLLLAQALVATNAGRNKLATKNRNHFRIRCFATNCKTGHCTVGPDTHKEFFRKYDTDWESWRAHSKMLSGEKYAHLKRNNASTWAQGLQDAGYSSVPGYAAALNNIIEHYQLQEYE